MFKCQNGWIAERWGQDTIGCAEMASPSGMSSVWCSCANASRAKCSRASTRRGRDMVGIRAADVERVERPSEK